MTRTLIDLSHPLHDGLLTHPGLPGPRHTVHRSREEYEQGGGMPFQIDRVELVGNTGTYLDSPFHRYADGADLASLSLGAAVLVWTGGDAARWIADGRAALVGVDAVNIDDLQDQTRPALSILLAAGVLILEHLTGLQQITSGRLHAAPLPWRGIGTWPVRAYVVGDDV